MNLLTFDIEEWYCYNRAELYPEFDRYLDTILAKLEERQMKATFFCVGEMGRLFPDVIRKIHTQGHEVGCHSNIHTWLNKMSESECREDTHRAVDSLEQCIGEKVKSYRAPAFSIGESNKWAFEILAENGIERDASVFPAARDFGGFQGFGSKTPCTIKYNGVSIKEFPICTAKVMGKEMAYSGGGYFRFFPLGFVEREMCKTSYAMGYFHIGDLLPEWLPIGYGPLIGNGQPMVMTCPIGVSLGEINQAGSAERIDSAIINLAQFQAVISIENMDGMTFDKIESIELILPDEMHRSGGNIISVDLEGKGYGQQITVNIDNFVLDLVKDHN